MKWHLLFYPILFAVTLLVCNNPFFWDTVQLASKHGHFFYDTDFQSLILPGEIDSGHPPLFGMYIAMIWKVFGKTLCASHLSMLPFIFGAVYFLHAIGSRLVGQKLAIWLTLICLADPVLASQMVLVSPDLVLVCCCLMALWAIWENKFMWLALAVIGLGLISTRGMMVGAALYLFSLIAATEKITLNLVFRKLLPFLPGGILVASYLFYHWMEAGWIGYHEGSSWAPSFQKVDFKGFVFNIGVMVWRFLDFGRVAVWLAILVIGFLTLKRSNWKLPKIDRFETGWQLILLTILLFLAIGPTQLFYTGLLAHRYFLPFFLTLSISLLYFLCNKYPWVAKKKVKNLVLPVVFIVLATGNFWIYPQKIAMGWDSTLAHLPWYSLLKETEDYLKTEEISLEIVGSAFPNIGSREIYELNGETKGFVEKDLATNCYLLFSNIMNDFSDLEIAELNSEWEKIFERNLGGVNVILYKNPKRSLCEN
ncbi:MAG: hypothetical protein K9J37_01045 [Saprospiraceae bacterium]|nr:hypothetical protein [Saprospiraceae bacterium]MCF8248462.1 hypothetical protein [Saprospiraceae bacterium]MCF8281794.1 hypothetical protein [Bacteroidales bacterium]MCF8310196.1 hypothetical protein [Saprospiraceae bacterium]MCF8439365.1 hypothetical protein [Saprospiraceae bacterium]